MEDGFSFEIRFSRVNSEAEHDSLKGFVWKAFGRDLKICV